MKGSSIKALLDAVERGADSAGLERLQTSLDQLRYPIAMPKSNVDMNMATLSDNGDGGVVVVPASAITDVGASVDLAESSRPRADGIDLANWEGSAGRMNLPTALLLSGFATVIGRVDFPIGFRTRASLSRAIQRMSSEVASSDMFDGAALAANVVALPMVWNGVSGRLLGAEITLGVSPLQFTPYTVRVTNKPTAKSAAQSPVPPTSLERGGPLIRDITLKVYTPTVSFALPFGWLETTQSQATPSIDIGDASVIAGSGDTAYFTSVPNFFPSASRGSSMFVFPSIPLTSATIAPATNSNYALPRMLPSAERRRR